MDRVTVGVRKREETLEDGADYEGGRRETRLYGGEFLRELLLKILFVLMMQVS